MAKSVYDGFMIVLSRLEPKPPEVAARKSHKKTIEQGLASEFAAYNNIKEMGSHTRDSAIHIFSDVDYLATLGRDDVTWGGKRVSSYTTLARVKSALDARFAQTDVWADGPAIVVGFGRGSGAVDVVPAIYLGPVNANGDGYPLFEVPDGDGWWRPSSPPRHSKYLTDEDQRSGYKLAKTIRLLKAWKYARSPRVAVHGFHLEMLLAWNQTCVGVKAYQNILLDAFRLIRDRGGAALNDPVGISGRIAAVNTDKQAQQLVDHAQYAALHAEAAINAEIAGNIKEAYRQWGLVFNGLFPSY